MSSALASSLPSNPEIEQESGKERAVDAGSLARRLSEVSISSAETNEEEEEEEKEVEEVSVDMEDEEEEEEVLLGPQVSLKEQLELDKDDDSLRKWKENLLGDVDLSAIGEIAEPEVKILSFTIISPNRPDLVLPLPFTTSDKKGYVFALKDASRYRIKIAFTVANNILLGLKYINTVWKSGIRVDSTKVMLGTFGPRSEPYTHELEEEATPSGFFARGSYLARTKFVDDDGKCHLDMSYYFEIRKEWPTF